MKRSSAPIRRGLPPAIAIVFASACAIAVAVAIAAPVPLRAHGAEDSRQRGLWEWSGVSRVVAIGDLHGSHDKLLRLLEGAGLVDAELAWAGGADHLVVAGDFLDRGPGDRRIMDLLRRLQGEAAGQGGRVHVLLGNHEVMNLARDTRYVGTAGFRAFAADETRAERRAAWRSFAGARIGEAGLAELRRDFQRRHPEGYFARQRLFGRDGEYGAWLITLPAVVKIDGVIYVHGGLTEEFAALGVEGINRRVLAALDRQLELREELERAGVLSMHLTLAEILRTASAVAGSPGHPRAATAGALLEAIHEPVLGAQGPLWYRGAALEDERIERRGLERSLELLDAEAMVIAHTYTGGNKITSRFEGRLFRVDHGLLESPRPLALLVERGHMLVLDPAAGAPLAPASELPAGRSPLASHPGLGDLECADLLRRGEVTHSVDLGRGSSRPRLVVLEHNGIRARGLFKTVEDPQTAAGTDRYQHEIAAFRLDRALGLDLVPLTVERELDGHAGSLQRWVERAVDREAAAAYSLALDERDASREQLTRAVLFDALIGNPQRRPDDVLLSIDDDRIHLVDHSRAFSTSLEIAWPAPSAARIEAQLAERLRGLDRAALVRELGSLLAAEQIDALLARRDAILGRFADVAGGGGAVSTTAAD